MPNTINIVQPKAEDGVTEVSYVTRTNSIFKSDGSPLGDSMEQYMDKVDELSQNLTKYRSIEYTALENSYSTGYYIVLEDNVLTKLGATEVCTAMIVDWANLQTVLGIAIEGGKVYLTFPLGHTFSKAKVKIKYGYR